MFNSILIARTKFDVRNFEVKHNLKNELPFARQNNLSHLIIYQNSTLCLGVLLSNRKWTDFLLPTTALICFKQKKNNYEIFPTKLRIA